MLLLGRVHFRKNSVEKSIVQAFLEAEPPGRGRELGAEKTYVAAGSGKRSKGQQRQQVLWKSRCQKLSSTPRDWLGVVLRIHQATGSNRLQWCHSNSEAQTCTWNLRDSDKRASDSKAWFPSQKP